jgi:inosine/xanthosine triphosphate pyrophosphatase family protein
MSVFVCTGNAGKLAEFRACFAPREVVGLREMESLAGWSYVEPAEDADFFIANALTKLLSALAFTRKIAASRGVAPEGLASRLLVDDSGLCVPALGFAPGVHSATLAGTPRDDAHNRAALRARLEAQGLARAPAFFVCYLIEIDVAQCAGLSDDALARVWTPSCPPEALVQLERDVHFPLAALACEERKECGGVAGTWLLSDLLGLRSEGGVGAERGAGLAPLRIAFGFCAGEVATVEQQALGGAGHGYDAMFYPLGSPHLSFASVPMEAKNAVSHRAQALRFLAGKD